MKEEHLKDDFSRTSITSENIKLHAGPIAQSLEETLLKNEGLNTTARMFKKDGSLWTSDLKDQKMIEENMGWLDLTEDYKATVNEIDTFSEQIKKEGFTHVVLLGMGGSSLCSEVATETFGKKHGYPELLVLDNTAPKAILAIQQTIIPETTLFIAASKSGGTQETISFFQYFYNYLSDKGIAEPGENFIAITDQGTPLVKMAEEFAFRKTFINTPGVGGRYSVLSHFGLVPMSLMGIDIMEMMARAKRTRKLAESAQPTLHTSAVNLGTMLGVGQQAGKDKITFLLTKSIGAFGYWVEQLLAESTGKGGKGLIPIVGESQTKIANYSNDRVFIYIKLIEENDVELDDLVTKLIAANHPVVEIELVDRLDLGAAFYCWEIAAAIAGMVMNINPFDQPNVEQSKANTRALLKEWKEEGHFTRPASIATEEGILLSEANLSLNGNDLSAALQQFLQAAKSGRDYVALLPYFMLTEDRKSTLDHCRKLILQETKAATTLLGGPRYLHSTGQLHKGGPNTGLFIMLTANEPAEIKIPNQVFGFATLHEAQYLGDFNALEEKGRRVLLINFGSNLEDGLMILERALGNTHNRF